MQVDTIPNIILQNPYRILGVYANSPKRDVVANKGRATAFIRVGQTIEFPLDLKGVLPPLSRTLEDMSEAEAHLAIAKEQIMYAQFWFLKLTPLDDVAFNHLAAGNIAGAKEFWSKQESLSSLQNKMVFFLIENQHRAAVLAAEKLYKNFGDTYIERVNPNSTLKMTGTDLLHLFLDTLCEELGVQKIFGCISDPGTKAYISSKAVGPLINKISTEVEKTKRTDHKDPKARIEAARKLVTNTKEAFAQIKSILPFDDSQYQMTADKLGLEILQCAIDYFIGAKDDDDEAPFTAMKMLTYARSVVAGNLAIQRCDDQIKELQKYIDSLPPKEVATEDKAIKAELAKYVRLPDKISYAITLLNNTKPQLQSIKRKLGATNAYYLKLSTQIVGNALHNVVEEVNAVQNDPQIAFRMQLGLELDSDSLTNIRSAMREAWKATTIMDEFDLEASFKSHYTQNRNTLKSMCNDLGIPTNEHRMSSSDNSGYSGLGYTGYNNTGDRSSEALWDQMTSHESSKWQAALFVTILGGIIGYLFYYYNPTIYDVDEKFKCIAWGTGIGSIAWLCMLVDDDNKSVDWGDLAARGGCFGVILFLGLFIFYWIYKVIRLTIDGIKSI